MGVMWAHQTCSYITITIRTVVYLFGKALPNRNLLQYQKCHLCDYYKLATIQEHLCATASITCCPLRKRERPKPLFKFSLTFPLQKQNHCLLIEQHLARVLWLRLRQAIVLGREVGGSLC